MDVFVFALTFRRIFVLSTANRVGDDWVLWAHHQHATATNIRQRYHHQVRRHLPSVPPSGREILIMVPWLGREIHTMVPPSVREIHTMVLPSGREIQWYLHQ